MTHLDRALRIGGAGATRRLGLVGAVYLAHLTFALAVAWPLAKLVGDPVMAHPRGDRVLFEPGALFLSETLRLGQRALASVGEGMSFGVLVGLYLGLVPLAALFHSFGREQKPALPALMAAAGRLFAPFSLLLGLTIAGAALASLVPLMVGGLLENELRTAFGERGADLAQTAFRAVALLVVWGFGVAQDLARAALATRETRVLEAIRRGLETLRAWPIEAVGGCALRGLAGLLIVTVAARLATQVGVETGASFFAVLVLHQSVAFALVLLRADWIALAVGLAESSYKSER
jgi:hypothetical protein